MVRILWEKSQFVRFLGTGAVGWVLYYGIYYALGEWCGRDWYLVWALVASIVYYPFNFFFQGRYVFNHAVEESTAREIRAYMLVSLILAAANELFLYGLTRAVRAFCDVIHCSTVWAEVLYVATPLAVGGLLVIIYFKLSKKILHTKTPGAHS